MQEIKENGDGINHATKRTKQMRGASWKASTQATRFIVHISVIQKNNTLRVVRFLFLIINHLPKTQNSELKNGVHLLGYITLSRCKSVVEVGVGDVVSKVLEGPLTGDDSLDEETEHGEHGETAVLDLLHLELSECVGVVSKAQGVEGTTGVQGVEALGPLKATAVVTVTLNSTHEDNLNDQGGDDGVCVDEAGEAEVLDALIGEDLGTSLEPGDVAGVGRPFGDDAAESTKHGPASVDELDLTVLGEGLGVSGETSGIPAVVTGELTLEVRHIGGEGAEEFGAVGAVPAIRGWISVAI